MQRLRFCLWGKSVGLVPNPSSGLQRQYDQALGQPDVRPNIERILFNIKALLDDASQVDEKYGGQLESSPRNSTSIVDPGLGDSTSLKTNLSDSQAAFGNNNRRSLPGRLLVGPFMILRSSRTQSIVWKSSWTALKRSQNRYSHWQTSISNCRKRLKKSL